MVRYAAMAVTLAGMLLAAGSCQLARKMTGKTVSQEENLVRKVIASGDEWKAMEIRLTGKAEEDNEKLVFIGMVKLERDSQVYVVLRSTIGIEFARLYANPDSVWVTSKVLNYKEKGDWKWAAAKSGYPIDFFALQGILTQGLFTSFGSRMQELFKGLVAREDQEFQKLVTNPSYLPPSGTLKYYNDFFIDGSTGMIQGVKIRDVNGQWITDVKYIYTKDNHIRKIELKGIDSERSFSGEITIIKTEIKDTAEINFEKF